MLWANHSLEQWWYVLKNMSEIPDKHNMTKVYLNYGMIDYV